MGPPFSNAANGIWLVALGASTPHSLATALAVDLAAAVGTSTLTDVAIDDPRPDCSSRTGAG